MCNGGGVESFFENAATQLMQAGWTVELVVLGRYDNDLVQHHRARGIAVRCFTDSTKKDTFFSLLFHYSALKRFLGAEPARITHINTCSHSVVIVLHCLKALGCRARILHSHTSPAKNLKLLRRFRYAVVRQYALKTATKMVACSKSAAYFLFPRKQIETGHVMILSNGIDLERFAFDASRRAVQREKLGKGDAWIIGTVGRLEEEKNLEYLLHCFAAFQKVCSNALLLLVGEGSLHDELAKKARALGLEPRVILTGQVQNVEDYLCAMDLFVMPSRYEGMPMALLEAQCSGLPCVVSDGVPAEACRFGNVIQLAPKADCKVWADTFGEAVHMTQIRQEAFRNLIGVADVETMGKALCALYEDDMDCERLH